MRNGKEGTTLDLVGILTMGLVLVIVGGDLGFGLGVWQAPNVRPDLAAPQVDPEAMYYRGAWEMCFVFATEVFGIPEDEAKEGCLTITVKQMDYEKEIPGFIAPK